MHRIALRPSRMGVAVWVVMALTLSASAFGTPGAPPGLGRPTTLQLSASPTTVTYPKPTQVSGRLVDRSGSGLANQSVRIDFKRASSNTWSTATTRTTRSDGTFSWAAQLSTNSQLRAFFGGTRTYSASVSPPVTVSVRPVISFTQTYVVGQGQKTRIGGSVSPAAPGRSVRLDSLSGKSWSSTGQSTTVDRNGAWGIDLTYSTFGDRTLRAVLASGTDTLGATSPQRTVRVTYPFQTVVSTGGTPRVDITRVSSPDGSCTIGLGRIRAGANSVELHPGSQDPGGTWNTPNSIPPNQRAGAVAAFNSGFQMKGARGGFRLEGQEPYALRNGAASLVAVSGGTWRLGTWGRDVSLSARVVSVRQNLELMVDNSKIVSTIDSDIQSRWGGTVHSVTYTWRTGIGIDPAGNLVYVMGPCLSPRLLAQSLVNGGAVRAMELDINHDWPTFDYYTASSASSPVLTAHKLLPNETNPPEHYFFSSKRDFFSAHLR